MTLIDRVRQYAKQLDHKIIAACGRGEYPLELADMRGVLEECAEALARSGVDNPKPGQEDRVADLRSA